jgi:hypothetical protein
MIRARNAWITSRAAICARRVTASLRYARRSVCLTISRAIPTGNVETLSSDEVERPIRDELDF